MTAPKIDLVGQRFTRLVVVARAPSDKYYRARWLCRCDCGTEIVSRADDLLKGCTKSCSCLRREMQDAMRRSRRGKGWAPNNKRTPEYRAWCLMKARCYRASCSAYQYYGGRGIIVCDRWRTSFDAFLEDMGPRPDGMSLDRIDFNGSYEPTNCRWATATQQARNSRQVRLTEEKQAQLKLMRLQGYRQKDVADRLGVSQVCISDFEIGKTWYPES